MSKSKTEQLQSVSKRDFLQAFAAVGGVSAAMTALDGWGIGFASAADAPPDLMGRSEGTRVLVLGGGLSGAESAALAAGESGRGDGGAGGEERP